jgi:hypothetical protein
MGVQPAFIVSRDACLRCSKMNNCGISSVVLVKIDTDAIKEFGLVPPTLQPNAIGCMVPCDRRCDADRSPKSVPHSPATYGVGKRDVGIA